MAPIVRFCWTCDNGAQTNFLIGLCFFTTESSGKVTEEDKVTCFAKAALERTYYTLVTLFVQVVAQNLQNVKIV